MQINLFRATMKRLFLLLSAMFMLIAGTVQVSSAQNWKIANDYAIQFSSADVSGIFKNLTGSVIFDEHNLAISRINVSIAVNAINTGNAMMNKHAKDEEWFDAARFSDIKFVSKSVAKTAAGYLITGNLTLRGVTREISFPFNFKTINTGAIVTGAFSVNRSDFKIGKPGGEVAEAIKINLSIPLSKI
jgi:polyisoprenoid-binding protein YceI